MAWLPGDHDASDVIQAMHFANSNEPLYLGVFLQREAPTFEQQVAEQHSGEESSRTELLEDLFKRFS